MATRRRRTKVEEPVVEETVEVEEEATEEPEAVAEAVEEEEVAEELPDFGQGHGALLRTALYRHGRRFLDYLQAAQDELTPENVHQLRVSSRKLSSTLSMLSSLVGRGPVKKLRRKLRKVRRSLGVLRDLQRQLEWLCDEPLLDDYLTERSADLPSVIKRAKKDLRRIKPSKLEKRLEMVDALLAGLLEEEQAEESVREMLSRTVWESLLQAMSHADEVDPDNSFSYHPLRVAMKSFRYQAEVYAAAGWETRLEQQDGWAKVKELHDALGHLQDLEVLACHLDFHWVQSPPIRETQARVVNRLLKDRHQALGRIHLQDLDWEQLWEWPQGEIEELLDDEA
ncbi:MAG: CHAD domain-containing protein [Candidatus Eremiobacteraeota bacterium]|nr:CHAD domain-containing protein [Candidatus Eremiobacteraeota bacterium]MCW5868390.1 CHAD domain-containing protein [Candidatus Eremiobacteraeota bacterium]